MRSVMAVMIAGLLALSPTAALALLEGQDAQVRATGVFRDAWTSREVHHSLRVDPQFLYRWQVIPGNEYLLEATVTDEYGRWLEGWARDPDGAELDVEPVPGGFRRFGVWTPSAEGYLTCDYRWFWDFLPTGTECSQGVVFELRTLDSPELTTITIPLLPLLMFGALGFAGAVALRRRAARSRRRRQTS